MEGLPWWSLGIPGELGVTWLQCPPTINLLASGLHTMEEGGREPQFWTA